MPWLNHNCLVAENDSRAAYEEKKAPREPNSLCLSTGLVLQNRAKIEPQLC